MDAATFHNRLAEITTKAHDEIVALVNQAQADEGLAWDTGKAVSFAHDPGIEREIDGMAELAGWVYDRLDGKNRLSRRSVTKRIRKALGYTQP